MALGGMDWVHEDGKVHDPQRIDYTSRYLKQVRRAIDDGVDVRGYFHWTLMDNFEWAEGYRQRFGSDICGYSDRKAHPQGFLRLVHRGDRLERRFTGEVNNPSLPPMTSYLVGADSRPPLPFDCRRLMLGVQPVPAGN